MRSQIVFTVTLLFFNFSIVNCQICSRNIKLAENQSVTFESGACTYYVSAPLDHEIFVQCQTSFYPQGNGPAISGCVYISTDGNPEIVSDDVLCTAGLIKATSLFDRAIIVYNSTTSNNQKVLCQVKAIYKGCDCGWSVNTKIVGGSPAGVNEYPFMAGLVNAEKATIYCGGSIITHRYVLTAAHCVVRVDVSVLLVVVGEANINIGGESPYTQIYTVESVQVHENYRSYMNDIALVRTHRIIQWSRGVGPVCLPILYRYASFQGSKVQMAGWGSTRFGGKQSPELLKTTVQVISNFQCGRYHPNITPRDLCTYSNTSDACQYDSGGPVILTLNRFFLVGIISFGKTCADGVPGVNTRITSFLEWISDNTNSSFCAMK